MKTSTFTFASQKSDMFMTSMLDLGAADRHRKLGDLGRGLPIEIDII